MNEKDWLEKLDEERDAKTNGLGCMLLMTAGLAFLCGATYSGEIVSVVSVITNAVIEIVSLFLEWGQQIQEMGL